MRGLPTRVVNLNASRARFGAACDQLCSALGRSDGLADSVVEDFSTLPPGEGFRLLERALAQGIDAVGDAPASLHALFETLDRPPAWVDWSRIERAGRLFFRASVAGGIVLGAKSLALGYCAPAGNKPLVMTGRLRGDMKRRLGETGRFVQATCSKQGLRRDQPGFAITVKVRIMHAQVRRLLLADGRWRSEAWALPINQHDMLATTLLFSLVFVDGIRQFGVRVSRQEAEDYQHLWRYAGHLMGVEAALLPKSVEEARRAEAMILGMQAPPDDDSKALVKHLIEAPGMEDGATAARQVRLGYGFARVLLGDALADQLGLPNDSYRFAIPVVRPVIALAEAVRQLIPFSHVLAEAVGRRYWRSAVKDGVGKSEPRYAPPLRLGMP